MSIRFAAIGLSHPHIFDMTAVLLSAGAELVWFQGDEPQRLAEFGRKFPQAKPARSVDEILEDLTIHLIVSAAVPDQRAALGMRAMQRGKDFLSAKPGFTTHHQLEAARQVQRETHRIYAVYFSERLGSAATVKAGELVASGAIGQVFQTVGFGPHKLGHVVRPAWTFQRERSGGILTDLASHQIDQFLFFTGSTSAEIVAAQVGNITHPEHPEFEDFGELYLRSEKASGYIRVDWLTPQGLDTWGDVRLFLMGTSGYIEIRKNCDLGGRAGKDHLFMVNQEATYYIHCEAVPLPFAGQFIQDVLNRTETAIGQAHVFLVSELALAAQAKARRLAFSPQNT